MMPKLPPSHEEALDQYAADKRARAHRPKATPTKALGVVIGTVVVLLSWVFLGGYAVLVAIASLCAWEAIASSIKK